MFTRQCWVSRTVKCYRPNAGSGSVIFTLFISLILHVKWKHRFWSEFKLMIFFSTYLPYDLEWDFKLLYTSLPSLQRYKENDNYLSLFFEGNQMMQHILVCFSFFTKALEEGVSRSATAIRNRKHINNIKWKYTCAPNLSHLWLVLFKWSTLPLCLLDLSLSIELKANMDICVALVFRNIRILHLHLEIHSQRKNSFLRKYVASSSFFSSPNWWFTQYLMQMIETSFVIKNIFLHVF